MIDRTTVSRLTAMLTVLALASGCQQIGSKYALRLPWSERSVERLPTPLVSATAHGPLSAEQKADMQIVLARGMDRQGRYDEARDMYLKAVEANPDRADAYHRLALLHDRQGECQTATEYYQQALEGDPENSELHCDVGYSRYLQQRWQEAEASLRRAIALTPDLRRAHNNLGLVLARTGREQEALEEFARAGCDRADAHANLAHAMMLSNRWNEAQVEFQRALDTNPDLPAARAGLRSLRSLMAKQDANAPRSHQPAPPQLPILATYTEPIQEIRR